jgi:magnesium transporter
MDVLLIQPEQVTQLEGLPEQLPGSGFLWIDLIHSEKKNWHTLLEKLNGVVIHDRHIHDSENASHPSYYDGMDSYEMLIFRGLSQAGQSSDFKTRPAVFFLMPQVLVTIRPEDSVSVAMVKPKLLDMKVRIPRRPAGLMHLLMTIMVDRFLALRNPLSERFESWRNELLDPTSPFDDWMTVMNYTSDLRKLEHLCEEQMEALQNWRENTSTELDDHINVRLNDLVEHISRVHRFSVTQKQEAESLVQLHFSAVAHRTNEIMRVLTLLSAIFLPLGLIAGIFGMNFEYMPELKIHYGYFLTLGGMLGLALILLVIFKIKRWF